MGILREERILKSGSPTYTITLPSVSASAIKDYDLAEDDSLPSTAQGVKKYLPIDYVEITNDDVVNVSLIWNQVNSIYVPKGVIKEVKGINIWRLSVKNEDSSTATVANAIRLVLKRQAITVDTYLRKYKLGKGELF